MEWNEIGSMVAVLGAAGSFLIWLYKILVQRPDQRNQEETTKALIEAQKKQADHLEKTLMPLTYQIKSLNENLNESKKDREAIHEELEEHEEQLIDHDKRISILERR